MADLQIRQKEKAWHHLSVESTLEKLEVKEKGLAEDEAKQRREKYGPNQLPEPPRTPGWKRFLAQIHNVLIYVLLAAAVGTAFLGEWLDTAVILGVVLINAVIGYIQEGKAEEALNAIRNMLSPNAVVIRGGRRHTIPAEELVPGDVVALSAGDRVPADLRLIRTSGLRIDEAILTGESQPADKSTESVPQDAGLGDRTGVAFSGTMVSAGQGRGVVIATGGATEIGRISKMVSEVETLTTPLLREIAQFGRVLAMVILVVSGLTLAVGVFLRDLPLAEMFLAAVSLAVAAIPEGLPAIMTITLAIGVQQMAKRRAIIRRLPAVETLGSITTICSDKTGTLTRNEMAVQTVQLADRQIVVSGEGYSPAGEFTENDEPIDPRKDQTLREILTAAALCNEATVREKEGAWRLEGMPTEGALVTLALKAGLNAEDLRDEWERVDILPFDSAHKFMATLNRNPERPDNGWLIVKGAPEVLMSFCEQQRTQEGDQHLDQESWEAAAEQIAERGQRLLAIAAKQVPADHDRLQFKDIESGGFTLLATFGIIDPPRSEAIQAVADCQRAGITVKMITGDHALTAKAIGRELGLAEGDNVVTGADLERASDEELRAMVKDVNVFARTTPEHKLRLVKAIQSHGEIAAMTGDGVNDAPALKRADIGIAMGIKGTEAAKDASEMVLTDDNFASIANAVKEGRTVYDNLRKAILYLLPTNGGQALTIIIAVMLGLTLPLTPVQVLWVNMVTAVTLALALAFEPSEPGVMDRPPRAKADSILNSFLVWRVAFVSLVLAAGTFGHFLWLERAGVPYEFARTVAINTLVVGQIFYLFNSRMILQSTLNGAGIFGNRVVFYAIGALVLLQLVFTYFPPMQTLFGTAAMGAADWGRCLAFGAILYLLVEVEKAVIRRR